MTRRLHPPTRAEKIVYVVFVLAVLAIVAVPLVYWVDHR